MTDKQTIHEIVDQFFRCIVCDAPTRVGAPRLCELHQQDERTEVERQKDWVQAI